MMRIKNTETTFTDLIQCLFKFKILIHLTYTEGQGIYPLGL